MKWLDKDKSQAKLPSEVELQWASDKWDYDQVFIGLITISIIL